MKRKKIKPFVGWIQQLSDGRFSSLLHSGKDGESYVQKQIKCARLCGEDVPNYIKVRVTEAPHR